MINTKGMIVLTGAAGFIGANLLKALNKAGRNDIIVVDDLTDGHKFENLVDCEFADYLHFEEFADKLEAGHYKDISAVFHQGACSTTTEWNGRYMMENNFSFSKKLLHHCLDNSIQLIYASSAAVYGGNQTFVEKPDFEKPLNVYGYSKLLFDQYVRRVVDLDNAESQVVGLRYFNVYGPREQHKGGMASVAFHFNNQLAVADSVKLFEGSDGYESGEQRRDFVYVGDVVSVNMWFLNNPNVSGIYNTGTGRSQTFNDVARAVIAHHGRGSIEYIPFPEGLKEAYQSFTQADISALRGAGYSDEFKTVEQAVPQYLQELAQ